MDEGISLMCRTSKMLFNFDPPVTPEEIRAAVPSVRPKVQPLNKPSRPNEVAFLAQIDAVAVISTQLLYSLETNAPPRNREKEAAKAKARAAENFPA